MPKLRQPNTNLIRERKKFGISQESLARQAGVSRQSIVYYEAGMEPRVGVALKISMVLGVDVYKCFKQFLREGYK